MVGRLAISSENIGTAVREPVPAAQYVRMSTEHQRYSTENQSDAILQYAVATASTSCGPTPTTARAGCASTDAMR